MFVFLPTVCLRGRENVPWIFVTPASSGSSGLDMANQMGEGKEWGKGGWGGRRDERREEKREKKKKKGNITEEKEKTVSK